MPTVNFYLKKPEGNPPKSLIYLQMRYRGEKFVYSVGENIAPNDWDKNKQQVKEISRTTKDGKVHLNSLLAELKKVCIDTYNLEIKNGIPTKQIFKTALDNHMNRNIQKGKDDAGKSTFFELIESFISGEVGDKKTDGTIKTYQTAKKHLLGFQKNAKYPVDFDTINLDFKYKYVKYLGKDRGTGKKKEKALSHNSIAKEIKNVKTFMNMAVELGYTTNLAYKSKKFSVAPVDTEAVYLTENELRSLYKFDFSDNKRLEAVRDLFVFNSFVGLRYSDASNIKPENIVKMDGEDFIKVMPLKTQKSKSTVTIPCNDIVLKIFKKYKHNKNRLPPAISGQKYNQYLKELCQIAGLTETGRLTSDLNLPLYACIKSHTARRNFATNMYLSGMDTRDIMQVTGHKTEKSFLVYIKVTRDESAKRMSKHMKTRQANKLLKAV